MALTINTNLGALRAQRNVANNQTALAGNLGRLSTGLRINTAADDAAGLAISENLRAQIRSLAQAERNANDAVSLIQTAEGSLNEVSGIMTRMRELAVQAANGTLGTTERGFLDDEFQALSNEIDRIAEVTEFNGINLLDGSASAGLDYQVGINATSNDTLTVSISDMHANQIGATSTGADTIDDIAVTSVSSAQSALAVIDQAISDLSSERANLGAAQNRLNVTIANLGSARENLAAANSRIRDVDIAQETAAMTRNNILLQAGVAVLAQANQNPDLALSLLT
ncbi:MAG: flagellin FliC [Proteobacteria bacterium]|nr:flagellin FliC [Pseudomonadota bacterium]